MSTESIDSYSYNAATTETSILKWYRSISWHCLMDIDSYQRTKRTTGSVVKANVAIVGPPVWFIYLACYSLARNRYIWAVS